MSEMNKTISLFNTGDINQVIIINPKIDPLLKIIKKDFYSGRIASALKSLQELITEYDDSRTTIYQLLKLKAHFLLALYKTDDYVLLVEYLKELTEQSDNDYKQLELFYYMIKLDRDNYFSVAKELSIVTGTRKEFFELQYYTNTDPDKAIEIYEKYFIDKNDADSLFLGAFAYLKKSTPFFITEKNNYYYKHLDLYKKCIEQLEIENIIEKVHYLANASLLPINFILNKISENNCPVDLSLIDEFILTIERFDDNIQEFDSNYLKHIINQYLLALAIKKSETKFIKTASSLYVYPMLSTENFLQYHSFINDLNDDLILKRFEVTNDYDLITLYTRSLNDDDKKLTVDFIRNNNLYNSEYILNFEFYFLAEIFVNQTLAESYMESLYIHKDDSIEHFRLYIKIHSLLKIEIQDIELKKLFEFSKDEKVNYNYLLDSIKFLFNAGFWEYGFELALNKKALFPSITQSTIISCSEPDTSLSIYVFEKYIIALGDEKIIHSNYIGLIYHNFQNFKKAFEYYSISWKSERAFQLAANIFSCLMAVKSMTGLNSEEESALEESVAFIESNNDLVNFRATLNIAHYFIEKKDYSKGLKLFNKNILRRDVNSFDQEEIDNISSFFHITANEYKFYDDITNYYINHDGKNLIYDGYELSDSAKITFNLEKADDLKLRTLRKNELQRNPNSSNEESKILCLSSFIAFYFLRKASSCTTFTIDESFNNDPLAFLDNILKPYNDKKEEFLMNLPNENIRPFFQIEADYLKFSDLIKTLLTRNDIVFFTGYNIPQKNLPKLLTITSIFFLDHIGYLSECISNQPDIYVQKSVFKFFFDHNEKNDNYDSINKILMLLEQKGKIIDDSIVSPLYMPMTKFRNLFGVLDYNAMCISLNGGIQLISDDPSLLKFFGAIDSISSIVLPTNSVFLIYRFLAGKNDSDFELNKIMSELHSKKYKYILPFDIIEQARFFSENEDLITSESVKTIVEIAKDYNWLNDDDLHLAMSTNTNDVENGE